MSDGVRSAMATTSGYIEVNGARLWYETTGDGDALLLTHAGIL